MFHGRQINDKINKIHERALRIVYDDKVTSFGNLLIKDKSFTIQSHQQLQNFYDSSSKDSIIAIEIYKAIHKLPGGNLSDFLVRNNHHNYNLRSESELLLANANTVFKE